MTSRLKLDRRVLLIGCKKRFGNTKSHLSTGAAIVVLLIAGLVGTGTMWIKTSVAEADARVAESDAVTEARKARDAEAEAVEARIAQTHKSYSASLNQARAQRWSGRTGQHYAAAEALAQANETTAAPRVGKLRPE